MILKSIWDIRIHQVASWYKRAKDVPESIQPIGFSPTHQ